VREGRKEESDEKNDGAESGIKSISENSVYDCEGECSIDSRINHGRIFS
jgi:hypothetical protein